MADWLRDHLPELTQAFPCPRLSAGHRGQAMNPRVIGACCGRSDPQAPSLKTLTFAILALQHRLRRGLHADRLGADRRPDRADRTQLQHRGVLFPRACLAALRRPAAPGERTRPRQSGAVGTPRLSRRASRATKAAIGRSKPVVRGATRVSRVRRRVSLERRFPWPHPRFRQFRPKSSVRDGESEALAALFPPAWKRRPSIVALFRCRYRRG